MDRRSVAFSADSHVVASTSEIDDSTVRERTVAGVLDEVRSGPAGETRIDTPVGSER